MRKVAHIIALLVATNAFVHPASAGESAYDCDPWSHLAVQDGGPCKPMDSLAWSLAVFDPILTDL